MKMVFALFALFVVSLSPVDGLALSLGNNMTIFDGNTASGKWYRGVPGYPEDQEVEPGSARGQRWDLEAFFIDHHLLSMVGGFDFKNGVDGIKSGDIFLAVDQRPDFGKVGRGGRNGNKVVNKDYGYDFAIRLDFDENSYQVLRLSDTSELQTAYYRIHEGSSPWRLYSGGDEIERGFFSLESGLTDAETGFLGGEHFALSGIDLTFLKEEGRNFYAHFTMGCGNDNLMGYAPVPAPEPSTLLLFAVGGIALWRVKRKQ